jgi:uncharacterized protein (TIGR03435 family)
MRLRYSRCFLLASLAIACPLAIAQSAEDISPLDKFIARAAKLPAYDVISIHQNTSETDDSTLDITQDGVVIENATFPEILEFAYNIVSFELISDISGPVASARFDIKAKIANLDGGRSTQLSHHDLQAMIIPLLAERFHLRTHLVRKRLTVYEIVVGRNGPNFKLNEPEAHSLSASWGKDNTLIFKKSSMATLAGVLSDSGLHRIVVNHTGLKGAGNFSLKWSSDFAEEEGDRDTVSIFAAVQDQLGLKLRPIKLSVDTLVIDHVEMPTAN